MQTTKFSDSTSALEVTTYGDGEPMLLTQSMREGTVDIASNRRVVLSHKQTKQLIKLLRADRRAARSED